MEPITDTHVYCYSARYEDNHTQYAGSTKTRVKKIRQGDPEAPTSAGKGGTQLGSVDHYLDAARRPGWLQRQGQSNQSFLMRKTSRREKLVEGELPRYTQMLHRLLAKALLMVGGLWRENNSIIILVLNHAARLLKYGVKELSFLMTVNCKNIVSKTLLFA